MPAPRVRFAPSPTGFLHVGGARTALFNWLFARRFGGTFILRVEDTDQSRERPEYRAEIFDALHWLGLDVDEGPERGGEFGPYTQRERLHLYERAKERLQGNGAVYPCFCGSRSEETYAAQDDEGEDAKAALRCRCDARSPHEIEAKRSVLPGEPAWRFRMAAHSEHVVHDLVRGEVRFPAGEVEDFLITKAGGAPLYNFACVVDDAAMQITHVIRGEEHLANVPKQLALYAALEETPPRFAHLPILLNNERKKLSKRDGATAVGDYRRLGYLPEALRNFLALLGWSPGGDREVMPIEEIVERFDLDRVQKQGAVFDTVKLTWMNGEYIKRTPIERLADTVGAFIEGEPDGQTLRRERDHVVAVCDVLRERVKTVAEIVRGHRYLFSRQAVIAWNAEAVQKRAATPAALDRLREAHAALTECAAWDVEALEACLRGLAQRSGLKAGEYIAPIRVAITGEAVSPGIFETLALVGRELSLGRINAFLAAHRTASAV